MSVVFSTIDPTRLTPPALWTLTEVASLWSGYSEREIAKLETSSKWVRIGLESLDLSEYKESVVRH